MINKIHELIARRSLIAMAVCATAVSGLSYAEEAEDQEEMLEEVVVTGSRITRSNVDSTSPITIIGRSEIEELAQTSIGDFLQDLPENVGGLNAQNNNGGNGSTQISLRGLGSGRTLVLLNGRRHVPYSTGGTVDMNAIAPNAIERIEVLNDGASTVYGADAVAGVINIITRQDYEGAEITWYEGISQNGGGEQTTIDATFGASNERGNVTVSVGHYQMKEVMAGERDWAFQDLGYDYETGEEFGFGSSATPEGTIIDRLGEEGNAAWQTVRENGQVVWGPGGLNPSSTWSEFSFDGNSDTGEGSYYNYQPENYLYTPQERTNVFVTSNYQLTDDVNGFAELSYINRRSDQLLAPTPLFIISEGLTIAADQFYNPFGRDFIDVRRRMVEAGNRNFIQDINTFRFVGGIDFSFADWDADVSFNYGRTDGTEINEGRFIRSRVLEALGSDCVAPCVPLNLFGGPGSISQDQIDWISYTGTAKTTYTQKSITANVSNSNLFDLPAGSVGIAFGIDSREETGQYVEDPLTEAGDTTGNKGESTRGGYDVDELYLELLIPLIDSGSLGTANLEYSIRYSDYSNFGDTDNQKVGFRWDFNDMIAIRASVSEAFKAPAVSDLFAGQADSFPTATDPCSNFEVGSYNSDPTVKANCDADGYVGGVADDRFQLRARVGGNPDLGPETADSNVIGIVLNPMTDLSITVDAWTYEIENTIGSIGVGTILGQCYGSTNRNYCDKIQRDANGLIQNIFAATANIGEVETAGYDIQANYDMDLASWGSLSLGLDYTIIDKYEIRSPSSDGVSTNVTDCVGVYDCGTLIENRWILDARWNKGDFRVRARLNYYGNFDECEEDFCNGGDEFAKREIDSRAYVSLGLGYDLGQGTNVGFNVSNLTDEDPPRIYNGFYSGADASYDFMGRYYTLSVNHNF